MIKGLIKKSIFPLFFLGLSLLILTFTATRDITLVQKKTLLFKEDGIQAPVNETDSDRMGLSIAISEAQALFGIPILSDNNETERLPETTASLTLKGTFANSNNSFASALIAEDGEDTQRIFLGEEVTEGVNLVGVERELVILRRNNQDEVLRMENFGEINLGPELSYKDRLYNSTPVPGVQTPEVSVYEPSADEANESYASEMVNTDTNNDRSVLSSQERLVRLRARYSQ